MSLAATASVGEALAAATEALAAAGVDSPRLDAEVLLAETLRVDRARLAARPEAGVEPAAARAFGAMIRRRVRREPVAYIVGRKAFRSIELALDARALIPRPESELLVEVALERSPEAVLDVGTGSGAVALAIASELPGAAVTATDISPATLQIARENAARLGLADRVRFEPGTLPQRGRFDLTVANLPYVRDGEWRGLAAEITDYEPRQALVGGPDGLRAIREVIGLIAATPDRFPVLALEVGMGQAEAVAGLMRDAEYKEVHARRDLAGIERVVVGQR